MPKLGRPERSGLCDDELAAARRRQPEIKNLRGELSPKNVSLEYHLGDIL